MTKVKKKVVVIQLTCGPWTKKFQDWFLLSQIFLLWNMVEIWKIEAANTFTEFIEEKYKDIKLSESGLFVDETLPYVGASPDLVFLCSCSEKGCVEIKCPY